MKTVCVFATLNFASGETGHVVEHCVFGENCGYETASEFVAYWENMWKKHCGNYKITNVVIG